VGVDEAASVPRVERAALKRTGVVEVAPIEDRLRAFDDMNPSADTKPSIRIGSLHRTVYERRKLDDNDHVTRANDTGAKILRHHIVRSDQSFRSRRSLGAQRPVEIDPMLDLRNVSR
jgi:hypothetical protein